MKKHAFDPLSFVFGIIFLMIAAASLFTTDLDYRLSDWVLPASVLVLGIGLLAASFRGVKSNGQETTEDRQQTTEDRQQTTDNNSNSNSEPSEETLVE